MLPFSAISSLYFSVAGLAIDKVMAPVLIFIWLGLLLIGKYTLDKKKLLLLIYVFIFFIVRNISFMDNATVFSELIWRDIILFGYFTLPVLFIDNLKRVDVAAKLISVTAVVGCVSAFLVALSIIELPYDRFSESRLGFSDIQKSIGVISSYGDVTQLAAFFLLFGLTMPYKILPTGKKSQKLIKFAVFMVVVMGLIGNQSRSYLLSLVFACTAVVFFSYRSKKSANTILIDMLAVLSVVVILPLMLFMLNEIISMLSHMGGAGALGTASARLEQFEMAISLIRENPLFGVGSEFYMGDPYFTHGVHNFWLGQMVKGGIVSALLFLIILINILKSCIRLYNNSNTISYAKVLTGYLAALFLTLLFYPADSGIFWALLGMSASIIYVLTKKKDVSNENTVAVVPDNKANNRIIPKRVNL